ncbi:hypothetical protein NDU88_009895 [Pleurodeles waltl]|uniref:Uncharacterized protein n=1 Tax=Pleurodeles waltl TaxID=8319 RepID=A0AAV7PX40_PLEWA|nr:hypothetical protein NDU88_009895 [Pleurodeles waltl]
MNATSRRQQQENKHKMEKPVGDEPAAVLGAGGAQKVRIIVLWLPRVTGHGLAFVALCETFFRFEPELTFHRDVAPD